MPADLALIGGLRAALAGAGDREKAVAQQAYMKSALPFYGIAAPELKRVLRPMLTSYRPAGREAHEATVRTLWDEATHREEWYAALAIARHRAARDWLDAEAMPLWQHLVVTGAWWDVVDEIASHLVGETLAGHRREVTPVIRGWATDEDPWLRRTSVICQLRSGDDTDRVLLRHAIESNVDDSSFWLRKAIGWALRQYAATDPDWVRAEVARQGDRMSGLSRREATRHLH
ncbi:MAG: DNA alkylation repair protein [Actinomycetota bacterium]|nr:DNA alkylation repair protein [Actinomycetota bacterium]